MVTKGVLNLTDESVLNTKADSSSLKRLSTRTQMSLESLLRGPHSLGTYIADETFDAVPSEQIPRPNDGPFFAAKYSPITKKHRDNIDVFQVEMPKKGRNSSQEQYSEALGNAFLKFYERYYGK